MTATATLASPVQSNVAGHGDLTADDLLGTEDDGLFELVNGRPVEKPMGYDSTWTATRLSTYIGMYILDGHGGDVLGEQSFRCFPNDPDGFRRPDVAFITRDRVPAIRPQGHIPFRPDLAVEVVSPTDNVYELEQKLADYEAAEVPLVWVLIPAVPPSPVVCDRRHHPPVA